MPDAKRPDPKRRSPASRPGRPGDSARGHPRRSSAGRRTADQAGEPVAEPIRRAAAESAEQRSEQRLGLTARRAAILAAVVCVLTLTIAGPVRTYFAQRAEMKQVAAIDASTQRDIDGLELQKQRLADPAYIIAMARERLGFVMPGETPYQVQIPATATDPGGTGGGDAAPSAGQGPWYSALWHTIADEPHGRATPAVPGPAAAGD